MIIAMQQSLLNLQIYNNNKIKICYKMKLITIFPMYLYNFTTLTLNNYRRP